MPKISNAAANATVPGGYRVMSIVLKALHQRSRIVGFRGADGSGRGGDPPPASRAAAADAFGEAETLLKSPGMPGILRKYLKDSTGDRQTDAGRTAAANAVRSRRRFSERPADGSGRPLRRAGHERGAAAAGRLSGGRHAGAAVAIVAARGEYEPGSFVVCRLDDLGKCDFSVGPLKTKDGARFPAADLDLRLVKVWYQNRNAWFNYFGDTGFKLVPELLLHDEDLIRVDESQEANTPASLRRAAGGRKRCGSTHRTDEPPVPRPLPPDVHVRADEARLRRCRVPASRGASARALRAVLPHGARPRRREAGDVFRFDRDLQEGKTLASVPVTLRVLPFVLPAPKAYCDPQRNFLVASYTYINIDMIKEENGGDAELAHRQLVAILRDHVAHRPDDALEPRQLQCGNARSHRGHEGGRHEDGCPPGRALSAPQRPRLSAQPGARRAPPARVVRPPCRPPQRVHRLRR